MNFFSRFFLAAILFVQGYFSSGQAFQADELVPGQPELLLVNNSFATQARLSVDVDHTTKNKVFVWQEPDVSGSPNRNIRCKVFNESMTELSSFLVNTTTTGDQIYPTVKVNQSDNSFVVAWSSWINNTNPSDVNQYDIYAKKIRFSNMTGDATNPDVLINDVQPGRQITPLIAFYYHLNEAVIAWVDQDGQDNGTPGTVDYGSYARRVGLTGATLYTMGSFALQFRINNITAGHQTVNSIEVSQADGALYTVCHSMGFPLGNSYDIVFRKFTRVGPGQFSAGDERRINIHGAGSQTLPNIVLNSLNGNYVISWTSDGQEGAKSVYFRVFDKEGEELKGETRINQAYNDNRLAPKLIWDENTNALIFYYWFSQGGMVNVRYQLFDGNYNFSGSEIAAESLNLQNYYAGLYSITFDKSTRKILLAYDEFSSSSGANSKGWFKQFSYVLPCAAIAAADQHYVEEQTITQQGVVNEASCKTLPETSAITSRTYFDGLGRPMQQVAVKGSPTAKDIVQPIEYDNAGRQAKNYLPYATLCSNGSYYSGWKDDQQFFYSSNAGQNAERVVKDAYPFSIPYYDNSPLNVVNKTLPQGASWHTADRSVRSEFLTNGTGEVRNWVYNFSTSSASGTGFYNAGTLSIEKVTDEDNNQAWQYTDLSGRMVLKKRQNKTTGAYLETHYVYDDLGHLRFVIPPQAVSLLPSVNHVIGYTGDFTNKWLFTYKYDAKGRLTEKKVPGAAVIYYVYDKKDRVAMSQDGNLRPSTRWTYIKYDQFDRPVISGTYTHLATPTQSSMQTAYNNATATYYNETRQSGTDHGYSNLVFPTVRAEALSINYYDDYDFDYNFTADHFYQSQGLTGEALPTPFIRGMPTGNKVRIIGTASDWLKTVTFYDKQNRPVQSQKNNHKNLSVLSDINTMVYDFSGKVIQVLQKHNPGSTPVTISNRLTYDHMGRLLRTYQKNNLEAEVMLSRQSYNELGEHVEKNLHSENGGVTFLQSVDYRYNIRGWMTHINNSTLTNDGVTNDDANDLFGVQLSYETPSGSVTPMFNGTITQQRWKGNNTGNTNTLEKRYDYYYDGLNNFRYSEFMTVQPGGGASGNGGFAEKNLEYDLNGNIKKLKRSGSTLSNIDDLTYVYNGNQLVAVIDSADAVQGFKNGVNASTEYTYDANGNMISDLNKGITSVVYNLLNLTQEVQFGASNRIVYTYTAAGEKLQKKMYVNNVLSKTVDYIGPFVYENNAVSHVATPEGRIRPNGSVYKYEYDLKDHLGNVRMTFGKHPNNGTAEIVQEDHYYVFGMTFNVSEYSFRGGPENKMLYNGKEKQDELGLEFYDFGARMYDAALGRWHSVDPLAESYDEFSPYNFCLNDPVNFVDPDGRGVEGWYKDENQQAVFDEDINSQEDMDAKGIKGTFMGKTGQAVAVSEDGVMVGVNLNEDGSITEQTDEVTVTASKSDDNGDSDDAISNTAGLLGDFSGTLGGAMDGMAKSRTELVKGGQWVGKNGRFYSTKFNGSDKWLSGTQKAFKSGTRSLKIAGRALGVASGALALTQFAFSDKSAGDYTQLAVNVAITGTAFIPVVGIPLSIGLSIIEMKYGDAFYNYVEE